MQDDVLESLALEQELGEMICGMVSGPEGQITHAHEADAQIAGSASCWGGQLAGDFSRCDALDASGSNPHFKHKLCAACQQNGISVPVDRVCAIEPSEHQMFTNSPGFGVWTERTHTDGSSILFRTVNQTRKCFGHRLVVFHSCPPQDIAWAPMAAEPNRNNRVSLIWFSSRALRRSAACSARCKQRETWGG